MDLHHEFDVERSVADTWAILTDVERIAPCLPGAQLTEIEGEEYRGTVKVKVGPITAKYKGAATFVEQNEAEAKMVLNAKGRDTRGQGNASAFITAQLTETAAGTHVTVDTDLTITGKVAQFGRGVIADVSEKILAQFVTNLETQVLADSEPGEAAAAASAASTEAATEAPTEDTPAEPAAARKIYQPEAEAVDLLEAAGAPMIKRVVPILGVVLLLLILRRLLSGRGDDD